MIVNDDIDVSNITNMKTITETITSEETHSIVNNDVDNRIMNPYMMQSFLKFKNDCMNDADFMLKRVQHGFYDDKKEIIENESLRIISNQPIGSIDESIRAIKALKSIFDETREGYFMMLMSAYDAYKYMRTHDVRHVNLILPKSSGKDEQGYFSSLSEAREYSAWSGISIGDAIETIENNNAYLMRSKWIDNKPSKFYTVSVDSDDYGIIRSIHLTDNHMNDYSYDFNFIQCEANKTNQLINRLANIPFIVINESITVSQLCLQIKNFLPYLKNGVLKPVNILHFIDNENEISTRSHSSTCNMMITMLTL